MAVSIGLGGACNLTAFTHSSTGPVVHPFASRREGPRFNPQGGTYVKPNSPVSVVSLQDTGNINVVIYKNVHPDRN
jgi:hypothetical protein